MALVRFLLYDSTASQVYVGLDKIRETSSGTNWGARWKAAVDNTARQVVTYNGAVIAAYYFSSCGGHTENIELAWPNASAQPYLKGVSDLNSSGRAYCQHDKNTSFSWSVSMSKADFESKLGIPNIVGLRVTKTGVSPRIVELEIIQSNGTRTSMQGGTFRSKLRLKSTWISNMGGTFPDVPLNYWAYAQIETLAEQGVISGYADGTFRPEVTVTRGEFAKMLCVSLGIPNETTTTFSDVPSTYWASPYIGAMANLQIVNGYPDGTFRPNANITRAEISTIISRAMGLTPGSVSVSFSDVSPTYWAKSDIELMASNSLVTGYEDGCFRPDSNAKRCEVAVIIYRTLGLIQ
jgi:SpoIID/LytB domain protein